MKFLFMGLPVIVKAEAYRRKVPIGMSVIVAHLENALS